MKQDDDRIEITQDEAFAWKLGEAENEAPRHYGGDVHRAAMGKMLEMPDSQQADFLAYCGRNGIQMGMWSIGEIQRLRRLCYDAGLDPDEPARRGP